jgi:glycosyltransferase involved in cell wall biosynthesis
MIIGIDAREIQSGVFTGLGRALDVFLNYFQGLKDENRIILFSAKSVRAYSNSRISNVVKPEFITFWWDQVTLPRLIKKSKIDLFYSPYYKIPVLCPCLVVSSVLDLIYLKFKPYRKAMSLTGRVYYRTIGSAMARRANAIITCSRFSKKDVIQYFRVNPDKVKVIYLGLDELYRPTTDSKRIQNVKRKFGIPGDYVLYVGNFKQHKNVDAIIESFQILSRDFPEVTLVLAGAKDKHYECTTVAHNKENMIVTGIVSIEDQIDLYSGASVFVIASLYEGFGFTPLEAMACGTPVISSDSGSLPEVIGTAGVLVDGSNPQQIAGKALEILRSPELRLKMAKAGIERAREFTKEKYSVSLYQLLLEIIRK